METTVEVEVKIRFQPKVSYFTMFYACLMFSILVRKSGKYIDNHENPLGSKYEPIIDPAGAPKDRKSTQIEHENCKKHRNVKKKLMKKKVGTDFIYT